MAAENIDRSRIEAAVRELLLAIGEDPDSTELSDTPGRVAQSYAELFSGVGVDATALLANSEPVGVSSAELVLMRDIELRSVCEHHLLPFRGVCHIAYKPHDRVIGLGALPRVVDALSHRPQLQERLTEQIADAINDALSPEGVLVVIDAQHGCVSDRGTRQTGASTVTIASRGSLAASRERSDVLAVLGRATP